MSYDEKPLPTHVNRRRSLFEDESQEAQNDTFKGFPEEKSEIYYPREYIDKVTSEIEQWKMHIENTLKETATFKSEKTELNNTVMDEKILTTEQSDFFDSVSLDYYMRKVEHFCGRVKIFTSILQYKPESEEEEWYRAAQRKIDREIKDKCNS